MNYYTFGEMCTVLLWFELKFDRWIKLISKVLRYFIIALLYRVDIFSAWMMVQIIVFGLLFQDCNSFYISFHSIWNFRLYRQSPNLLFQRFRGYIIDMLILYRDTLRSIKILSLSEWWITWWILHTLWNLEKI